jgi:hypothetical protein
MDDKLHLDAAYEQVKREEYQYGQAIFAHERSRMSKRPKPKFILDSFPARPSRSTIWDMVATALMAACWMAVLFGFYLLSK